MTSYDPDDTVPPRPTPSAGAPIDEGDGGSGFAPFGGEEHIITPARIGEYISFEQCSRYFKHAVEDIEQTKHNDGRDFAEAFKPLNILLSKAGEEFEEDVRDSLVDGGGELVDCEREPDEFAPDNSTLQDALVKAVDASPSPSEPTIIYQASLVDYIGDWRVAGDVDLILVWSTLEGARVRVIDVKSASEEKTYHQVQAATYVDLLRTLVNGSGALDRTDVVIDGGIVTRDDSLSSPTPVDLPSFDPDARIMDIHRLLSSDGEFTTLANQPLKDTPYQLNDKCANCAYNEGCLTDAYEDGHLRLLGLSQSEQEQLSEEFGIETVAELADLARVPDSSEWYPAKYEQVSWPSETYKDLKTTPGIGEKLPTLLYRAVAVADFLDPDGGEYIDRHVPWIPGTGRCPLPEDNPHGDIDLDWMHGSMVRVYLNVQTDHLRDKAIQLSARVTATASETEPQRLSVLADDAPDDDIEADRVERSLLEQFIEELYTAIRAVNSGIDFQGREQTDPPLHFYVYTGREKKALEEACARHDTPHINSLQSTLEGRAGYDQPMVSRLRPVIQTHTAVPTPAPGLPVAYDHISPTGDNVYRKSRGVEAWSYSPIGDDTADSVHLRSVFDYRLFNYSVDGERRDGDGVAVDPTSREYIDGVPSRFRFGAEIPLGYLWSSIGRIDPDWASDLTEDNPFAEQELLHYHYHDIDDRTHEITESDVEALGRHLCDAMEHIERSLDNRDVSLNKEPFSLSDLAVDTYSPPTLAAACKRYLWIEHTAKRREEYDHYRKFPAQRMLTGKTIPVTITDVEERTSRDLFVEGRLRFEEQFGSNSEIVRRACRKKGSDGSSGGSWMVANEYSYGRKEAVVSRPNDIEDGVQVILKDLDLEEKYISFIARKFQGGNDEFSRFHDKWTVTKQYDTPDNDFLYFANNEDVILDPQTDDITAARAKTALDFPSENALHSILENVRNGTNPEPETDQFGSGRLERFADWARENYGESTLPSDEQRAFITASDAQLVGLQGPPGTGKTRGTFAPALVARLYAAATADQTFAGLVTAPSNTAIDELLEDVASCLAAASESDNLSEIFPNTNLVRITGARPDNAPDNVTYIDYNDDDDTEKLEQFHDWITGGEHLTAGRDTEGQSQLTQFEVGRDVNKSEGAQTLVFATPGRAWRLVSEICAGSDDAATVEQSYWDIVAADEASMLTLPQFLLAGSAFAEDGQVLVGGDHRQLPPVQHHDYSDEARREIRAAVPYLSALDYIRLLRGEDVLDQDHMDDWKYDHDTNRARSGIPFVRLSKTYRFGQTTADLVEDAVYAADGIDYEAGPSSTPDTLLSTDDDPTPIQEILDPAPITLVTYDDEGHQQWNPIEASMISEIVAHTDSNLSLGVVTPHNAQRSRVSAQIQDLDIEETVLPETTVETVNRFQGGQQDVMLVSATVSDPQYISRESDFLLSENRTNVAFTRHQAKLVVLAPKSLLGYIAADADLYDQTLLWKLTAKQSGEDPSQTGSTPAWNDTLPVDIQRGVTLTAGEYEAVDDGTTSTSIEIYRIERFSKR